MPQRGPVSMALTFSLSTAAASYAALLFWGEGGMVWSDLINFNPNRPLSNVVFIMAIMIPLLAGYFVVLALSLPALAAGSCAFLARIAFRGISPWHLPAFAAICVVALRAQLCLVAPFFDPPGEPALAHPFARALTGHVLIGAFYLLPLAWAWTRTARAHAPTKC